jgi:hypothetical protein
MLELSYLNPKNWFLDAKEKKRLDAKRRYYGESLERALIDIDFPIETNKIENRLANLDIDEYYGRIDQFTKHMQKTIVKFGVDTPECKLEQLEIKKQFKKISDRDYEKELATLKGEPWVTVVNLNMNPTKPSDGYMELDWNDKFVENLKEAGYKGEKSELIVQDWFDTICKNVAKEYGAVFPDEIKEFEYKNQARKVKSPETGKTEIL